MARDEILTTEIGIRPLFANPSAVTMLPDNARITPQTEIVIIFVVSVSHAIRLYIGDSNHFPIAVNLS